MTIAPKLVGRIVIGIAICLAVFQAYSAKQQANLAKELEESPIIFTDWTPDKTEYRAGDLIKFTYTRTVLPNKVPLLMVMVETFSNIDTGEEFLGARSTKKLKTDGTEQIAAARRIPLDCTPGRYVVEGLANAQSTRIARAIGYSSTEFKIISR